MGKNLINNSNSPCVPEKCSHYPRQTYFVQYNLVPLLKTCQIILKKYPKYLMRLSLEYRDLRRAKNVSVDRYPSKDEPQQGFVKIQQAQKIFIEKLFQQCRWKSWHL